MKRPFSKLAPGPGRLEASFKLKGKRRWTIPNFIRKSSKQMFKKIQTSLVEYSCNRTLEVPTTDNVIGKIVPFKSTPGSVPS